MGIPLSEVLIAALRDYGAGPLAPARQFTYANWPEARDWTAGHVAALAALGHEIDEATGFLPAGWLHVAAWLASTHHQNDPAQQKRVITGHILRLATEVAEGGWRDRYRKQQAPVRDRADNTRAASAAGRQLAAPSTAGGPGSPGRSSAFPGQN